MTISLNTTINQQSIQGILSDNRQAITTERQAITTERPSQAVSTTKSSDSVSLRPEFKMGEEMVLSLGRVILGGNDQLAKWSAQGLDISEESLRLAFDSLNQGMKEHFNNPRSKGVVINSYQIVENSQDVPSWFKAEKVSNISGISDPDTKAAFEAGKLYHLNVETGANFQALAAYQRVDSLKSS